MNEEDYKNIDSIYFPNTVSSEAQNVYTSRIGFTFVKSTENGEMAEIAWIDVIDKEGKKIAHIKQSICDIYFTS